jgi:hypothetical protein
MPGLGTLSNAVIVGLATNLGLAFLPGPHALAGRIALMLLGIAGNAVATAMYIGARFGPGPRGGLMTGLHRRTGRPIWLVRTSLEASVVVLGWLLGGVFGVGTVLYAAAIAPSCSNCCPCSRSAPDSAASTLRVRVSHVERSSRTRKLQYSDILPTWSFSRPSTPLHRTRSTDLLGDVPKPLVGRLGIEPRTGGL